MCQSPSRRECVVWGCENSHRVSRIVQQLLLVIGLTWAPSSLWAEGDTPPRNAVVEAALRDDFLVLPIRTELQRATGKKFVKAKVLVLINAVDVIQGEDEAIDAGALKVSRIWEAIDPFTKGAPGNVVFQVWCDTYAHTPRGDGSWPASSILLDFLFGIGHRMGFQETDVNLYFLTEHSKYYKDWERAVADLAALPDQEALKEQAVGDEQVKLFPVRTQLSQLLYHDADCVIYFVPPIDEVDIASAIDTMKRCLPQLDLKKKDKVVFLNHWKDGAIADAIGEELMGKHIYADALGFATGGQTVRN